MDIVRNSNKEECIQLRQGKESCEVKLTDILKMKVCKDNPHLDELEFGHGSAGCNTSDHP